MHKYVSPTSSPPKSQTKENVSQKLPKVTIQEPTSMHENTHTHTRITCIESRVLVNVLTRFQICFNKNATSFVSLHRNHNNEGNLNHKIKCQF